MTLVLALAAACGGGAEPASATFPSAAPSAGGDTRPVVEILPTTAAPPPLDPAADPRTPLGELRAGYLPAWSPDFDWAFPPEVCGSDWALDAIAEPASRVDPAVLGDSGVAAALSVMRYEYLLSRALAEPDVSGQLCVAVAALDPARRGALERLVSHLATGERSAEVAGYPDEVTIVAASPTAALAVACITPAQPDAAPAPGVLRAYLLAVSRGLEDAVTDISYRVSHVTDRPAEDCGGLDVWAAEWERQAGEWAAGGAIWGPVGRTVTAGDLCASAPTDGVAGCPRDWDR